MASLTEPESAPQNTLGGYVNSTPGLILDPNTLGETPAAPEALQEANSSAASEPEIADPPEQAPSQDPAPKAMQQLADGNGEAAKTARRGSPPAKTNPWAKAQSAPEFLAEAEPEFSGLVKDLVAPGAITMLSAPKGLGKTQVSHALAVALATGGEFRGEQVRPVRVLLMDRDNPRGIPKKRLRAWGADKAPNLRVLTRETAPALTDTSAWDAFPHQNYDVLILDSMGSFTEGVTEKEGRQTTEILARLRDLAANNLSIILLNNTDKGGLNFKGRQEWEDRVDIAYEVRDATGFTPSGKRDWWLELPQGGSALWAERASRRKERTTYRLAFTSSKFRLGIEPVPFCLELSLPKDAPWTVQDVTRTLLTAEENAPVQAEQEKQARWEEASWQLALLIQQRDQTGKPLLKTEAEEFLSKQQGLRQKEARQLITEWSGPFWRIESRPGKGSPQVLTAIQVPSTLTTKIKEEGKSTLSEDPVSVVQDYQGQQKYMPLQPTIDAGFRDPLFLSSPGEENGSLSSQPPLTEKKRLPRKIPWGVIPDLEDLETPEDPSKWN